MHQDHWGLFCCSCLPLTRTWWFYQHIQAFPPSKKFHWLISATSRVIRKNYWEAKNWTWAAGWEARMLSLCYAAPLITGPLLLANLPPVISYNYLFVWTDLIIRNAINVCFYAALIKKCNSVSVCLADHLFKHSINRNRFHTKWMDEWFFSHSEKSGSCNFFNPRQDMFLNLQTVMWWQKWL